MGAAWLGRRARRDGYQKACCSIRKVKPENVEVAYCLHPLTVYNRDHIEAIYLITF